MSATAQELFRSHDLRVFGITGLGHPECIVVTFGSFTDDYTLDRPGFGEAFFAARGIDAIHVLSRTNEWYQYPEMEAAMATIHAATRPYPRTLAYGSSMGAYAALRLAGLAGATCVLALSPQFSIHPEAAPFEDRWLASSHRIRPVWEHRLPFPRPSEAYIAYDPLTTDRLHAELLARELPCTPIPIEGAGHPVTGFLADLALLEPLILAICRNQLDLPSLLAEATRQRHRSPQYLANLAEAAETSDRKIELLQQAARIAPNSSEIRSRLALQLGLARRFPEALALHDDILRLEPGHPHFLMVASHTLERSGDLPAALALMERALAASGQSELYGPRATALRAKLAAKAGTPAGRWLRRLRRPRAETTS